MGASASVDAPYGGECAFLWHNGVMVDLGTLGGLESFAFDVSNNGQIVVGGAYTADNVTRAFLWKSSTGVVDLGTLGGGGFFAN